MSSTIEFINNLSALDRRILLDQLLRRKASEPKHFPASFAQERLWFLDQLQPGSSTYNVPAVLPLNFPVNLAALEQSLNEIVRRHEVLRTTFAMVDGQPMQVIAPVLPIGLRVVELWQLPEPARQVQMQQLMAEEMQRPFDLSRGPMLRATVLRLGPVEHVLVLTMHHIVSDGWSMGILFRELNALYEGYCTGRPASLPELRIQYAD